MNYLHKKYKTFEQGLKEYVTWKKGFFPANWDKEDEEHAEANFNRFWNMENLKEGEIHN